MEKITLYTHDGVAHADDAFAVAALSLIYPNAEVVRTRDTRTLRTAAETPGAFLLDVGGVYNPETLQFDHHQAEGGGYREPQTKHWPYATAGLVWKHYGAQTVLSVYPNLDAFNTQDTVNYIDAAIMRYVDAVDCGVRLRTAGPSLSGIVSSFNSPWFEPQGNQFPLIVSLCQQVLINYIKRHVGRALARDQVRLSRLEMGGRLLILDSCVPWTEVVAEEMPGVKLVAYPSGQRDNQFTHWQIRAATDMDCQPRILFPKQWAGCEHQPLKEHTGERGAIFCHRSRHLLGVNGYDGMLRLASATLAANEFERDNGSSSSSGAHHHFETTEATLSGITMLC